MAKFLYKGINANGNELNGEIEGSSAKEVKQKLQKKGLRNAVVKRAPIELTFMQKVSVAELARFTKQFSVMFSAGLGITECFDILGAQVENPLLKKAVKEINQDIQTGSTIADALKKHPKIFSELYCHMVNAGEIGGILEEVLERLSIFLEAQDRLIRKVKGAMTYPVVITFVAIGAVVAMLKFVVPTFVALFDSVGAELPLPTRIVVGASSFLGNYFFFIVGGAIAFGFAFKTYIGTPVGRKNFDKFILMLPIFGPLTTKSVVARFTRTLGTLLHSGVNIIDALKITGKTADNTVFEEGIDKVITRIQGGDNLADPLEAIGLFPPMVTQMVNVGEKTGFLDKMLEKIADIYDEEVDEAVSALTAMLEPLVIVVMGVIIGGLLIAMYLPMFDLFTKI